MNKSQSIQVAVIGLGDVGLPLAVELGKKYPTDPVDIKAHESIYYALAYNEDNDAYFDNRREGGIIAPPMFAVNYASGPAAQIVFDKEVGMNFMMVVHYTQEFEWLKPVKPDDKLTTEGEIIQISSIIVEQVSHIPIN